MLVDQEINSVSANPDRPLQFSLRDLVFVVTIACLLSALVLTQYQTHSRFSAQIHDLNNQIGELQSRLDHSEKHQDKQERWLVSQLKVGDNISAHPDFLILADYEIDKSHELRRPFFEWQYKTENHEEFSNYAIYVFTLEFDSVEGVNEFFVVVVDGRIDRIVAGEAVCS